MVKLSESELYTFSSFLEEDKTAVKFIKGFIFQRKLNLR